MLAAPPSSPFTRRSARIRFSSNAPTVLIADDHDDSRTIARLVLESAQYRVVEARTGPEALAVIRAERPSVVLLDIVMPGLSGWDVARLVRHDPAVASTTIIALTALAGSHDREESFVAGCHDLLTKPVHPRALLATLHRYTGFSAS